MCSKLCATFTPFSFQVFGYACPQLLRSLYPLSTINAFHVTKNTRLSTPGQLQCLHFGVWKPGNETRVIFALLSLVHRPPHRFYFTEVKETSVEAGNTTMYASDNKKKMHDFRKSFPMTNVTTSFNIQIHTQSQWRHCCCNIQEHLFNCQLIQIRYLPLLVGKELHSISNVCTQLGHFTRKIMAPCLHREHKATERMPPNRIFLGSWVFQVM